jgi:peptidoglycan/xylan/chitin deacetylase (PgdA/CDA1 family)
MVVKNKRIKQLFMGGIMTASTKAGSQKLPINWPAERPIAMSVSVMLEGWTEDAAPGIGPMGNPLRAGVFDTQAKSWSDYGAQTGAWRLLDVLADTDTKAVFYVSGILAEQNAELMRTISSQGHIVAAHAWSQHIIPAYQTLDEELSDLKRCVATLEKTSGQRPKGWISPRATPSQNTPELLAREGFNWFADVFDRDLPYQIETKAGPILGLPFTMEINDFPLLVRYGNEPESFVRTLKSLLDGWSSIGSPCATVDLTAHAHVFGRPAGAIAFKNAINMCRADSQTFMTHHADIAGMFRDS